MAYTIQAGLLGGSGVCSGVYCGGAQEAARRVQQIKRGQVKAWKGREKLKTWTHIEKVAKRNTEPAPAPQVKKTARRRKASMGGGGQ